jgi:DNA-binding MarR family transcriptional regulator
MGEIEGLTALEMLILRSIPQVKKIEDLAEMTRVPPATLGREIAKLQIRGYIADDGSLTETGKEAVKPV